MAIKDAADDLFIGLHVDPKQLKKEQRFILQAMLELGAFSKHDLKPASRIVQRAFNSSAVDKYKQMMSNLRHRGLTESEEGITGGYWLTSVGRSLAGKLSDTPVIPPGSGLVVPAPAASNPPPVKGIAAVGPAKQKDSPSLTRQGYRRPASKVLSAKSSPDKSPNHPDWPAKRWVWEFLRSKVGPKQASKAEIVEHMRKAAPHISECEIDDAINNPHDFKRFPQPSGPDLYAISED